MADDALVRRLRAAGCVFAEDEARLLTGHGGTPDELEALVARRVAGKPLEQLLGWTQYCGLRVVTAPGVFVPRQRSALLVREAARRTRPGATVLDLCCGTGALGAALAARVADVTVYACDVSPEAVACARANGVRHAYVGDLFDPLPRSLPGRVDTLLANVPYVPSAALGGLPPEARDHEPAVALDGGPDGLDVLRRVASEAPRWLATGGLLLTETGTEQASPAAGVLQAAGLDAQIVHDRELGANAVLGRRS